MTVGPGLAEGDENCKKFLEKTMPDAFHKVDLGHVMCMEIFIFPVEIYRRGSEIEGVPSSTGEGL